MSNIKRGEVPKPPSEASERWPVTQELIDVAFEERGVWCSVDVPDEELSKSINGVVNRMVREKVAEVKKVDRTVYVRFYE